MKTTLIFLFLLSSLCSSSQTLSIQTGSNPAYCRMNNLQNGGGVVYVTASGGTPSYTYKWTSLQTGVTFSNSTWGALNPGDYEIKVWDANNDSVSQIVTVDSINPVANFTLLSNDIDLVGSNYIGFAPATVEFQNYSTGIVNPNDPFGGDTTFYWHFGDYGSSWILHSTYSPISHTYDYGGTYFVCLFTANKNGCADTSCQNLGLFGTVGDKGKLPNNGSVQLIEDATNHQLLVQKLNYPEDLELRLYNINGQLIHTERILNASTHISTLGFSKTLIYEIVDPKTSTHLLADKLILTQN